jgi:Protein of unknown function (DUF3093)
MRVYRERLGVPAGYWLGGVVTVLILGTTLWAGFSVVIAAFVYLGMGGLLVLALVTWGAITIEVTDTEVVVASRRLAIDRIAAVSALDGIQTTALRGPRADPAACLVIRPYLPESVYLEVAGRPAAQPYWLIGSRRPAELAAAIETARSRLGVQAACND